jgi:hypothetical protein
VIKLIAAATKCMYGSALSNHHLARERYSHSRCCIIVVWECKSLQSFVASVGDGELTDSLLMAEF